MEENECVKEYFMLGFAFLPNHKCVQGVMLLVKCGVELTSV